MIIFQNCWEKDLLTKIDQPETLLFYSSESALLQLLKFLFEVRNIRIRLPACQFLTNMVTSVNLWKL